MSVDEMNVEIDLDGLEPTEGVKEGDSSDGGNADSLESVRRDLDLLRGEFNASVIEAANGRKEISSLREAVTKLRDRLDAWEGNAEKRRELIQRLVGVDGPSEATRRKMALP